MRKFLVTIVVLLAATLSFSGAPPDRLPTLTAPAEARMLQVVAGTTPAPPAGGGGVYSIRLNDSTTDGRLERSSGTLNHNAAYTVMFWLKLVDRNTYQHFYSFVDSGGWEDYGDADWVGTGEDGMDSRIGAYVGGSGSSDTGTYITGSTWTHIALVRSSTTALTLYVGGDAWSGSTITTNVSSRNATAKEIVGVLAGTASCANMRIAAIKGWQSALSEAEIEAEMGYSAPQKSGAVFACSGDAAAIADAVQCETGTDYSYSGDVDTVADVPSITY